MFTGLVEGTGRVIDILPSHNGRLLRIEPLYDFEGRVGDSVAIDGVCLTISRIDKDNIFFFVSERTLLDSKIKQYKPGDIVNIERAIMANQRLGGHILTGHVDCTGRVRKIQKGTSSVDIEIEIPEGKRSLLIEKGSIGIDGVSLTIQSIRWPFIGLTIIPHTWQTTAFRYLKGGDPVNIEFDTIVKVVVQTVQSYLRQMEFLKIEKS